MITNRAQGFTLIEMVMVVVIMGVMASIAMKSIKVSMDNNRFAATIEEMSGLSRAVVGDERLISNGMRTDFGYIGDIGSLPSNLEDLASDPGYATWNGPYIQKAFSEDTDGFKLDAWNDPYAYSSGLTIVSNGGGQLITRNIAGSLSELMSNTVKGMVRDKDISPPGDSAINVTVNIVFPDGSGSYNYLTTVPGASGEFNFLNAVPIGIHLVRAIADSDTVTKYVAVYPGKTTHTELRFARDKW